MRLMDGAAEEGVPRFAFISVHDYKFPSECTISSLVGPLLKHWWVCT
jgi:hypothetical protein